MYFREKKSGNHVYLQIVVSRRVGKQVRQQVIATVGRLDRLRASGQFSQLVLSASKKVDDLMVSVPSADNAAESGADSRHIGLQLVFDRLWRETGCQDVIRACARGTRHGFDLERAVFLSVLHRLGISGPDRSAEAWGASRPLDGLGQPLGLHQLYRAIQWLGDEVGADGDTRRWRKDPIEKRLFDRRRTLFSELSLVFFDTTSVPFWGQGGEELARHGHSKDRRGDHHQLVLGLALDQDGTPVCCEVRPGNASDARQLLPLGKRLRDHFGIPGICLIADRGMTGRKTLTRLGKDGWQYITGVRLRSVTTVCDALLADPAPSREIKVARAHDPKKPLVLGIKEVVLRPPHRSPGRHVLCHSEEQEKRDRLARDNQVSALEAKLKKGTLSLLKNSGYRHLLTIERGAARIDREKIEKAERLDGYWALTTNTDLPTEEVVRRHKELWRVEQAFRTSKAVLETYPVYHRTDRGIRGHVFCTFLALLLQDELFRRMRDRGVSAEWDAIIRDLDGLTEFTVEDAGKSFVFRGKALGVCAKIVGCVGARLPNTVRQATDPTSSDSPTS